LLNRVCAQAGRWFLDSGIQEAGGGVARYYRSDLDRNAAVSTEITGYAISTLLYLHQRSGDPSFLAAALRGGRFLTSTAWDPALRTMPFEYTNGRPCERRAYFFDLGIAARGLLRLWSACRESRFLDAALACAESMARDFSAGCDFHPAILLPSKEPVPRDPHWSRSAGCYQLKAALAWRELAAETGDSSFQTGYDQVLDYALGTQAGFLGCGQDRERLMDRLHPYLYFLEGLLPRAGQPPEAAVLVQGVDTVSTLLRGIAPVFARCDVYAQLLRLRLYAAALGVLRLDERAAAEEASQLASFQVRHFAPRLNHGFSFGRKACGPLPYVNPASTGFAVQALEMWGDYLGGRFQPDCWDLI
jgi:hypothetical protein